MGTALDLLERRTSALVEGVSPALPVGPLGGGAARASAAVIAGEEAAIRALTARREALRRAGEAYAGATTMLTLQAATVSDARIDLVVTEWTTLTYKAVVGDEPGFTAFVAERAFHFARDADGWILVAHGLTNPDPPAPVNEP